jgi:D-sedoheptulose 7-phosphate isomerase
LGCKTIGLSGKEGGMFNGKCELNIVVPSDTTARTQEMHILIGHMICQAIDDFCG